MRFLFVYLAATLLESCESASRARSRQGKLMGVAAFGGGPPAPRVHDWARSVGKRDAPVVVEAFLDLMCPFSVKFYKTMRKDVLPKFGDDMKLVVYNYVQTWHWTSAVMAKASIAAGQLAPSRYFDAFDVLADLREKYTEQEMTETTYSQIVEELGTALSSEPASIPKEDFIQLMDPRNDLHSNLLTEVKFHTKYGRQNSIHITPTVLINGLVDNSISSSMSAEDWSRRLEFYKAQKIPS